MPDLTTQYVLVNREELAAGIRAVTGSAGSTWTSLTQDPVTEIVDLLFDSHPTVISHRGIAPTPEPVVTVTSIGVKRATFPTVEAGVDPDGYATITNEVSMWTPESACETARDLLAAAAWVEEVTQAIHTSTVTQDP